MWIFFKLKSFGIKLLFMLSHILPVMILHCSRSLGKFGGFWWQHLKMLVFENCGVGNWLWVFDTKKEFSVSYFWMGGRETMFCKSLAFLLVTFNVLIHWTVLPFNLSSGFYWSLFSSPFFFLFSWLPGDTAFFFESNSHFGMSSFLIDWNWMQEPLL